MPAAMYYIIICGCNVSAVLPPPLIALSVPVSREMEKIYDLVPRTDDVFNLRRNELELHDELGTGNFGSVLRGTYKHKGMAIPVAVKTLKKDDLPTAEVWLRFIVSTLIILCLVDWAKHDTVFSDIYCCIKCCQMFLFCFTWTWIM